MTAPRDIGPGNFYLDGQPRITAHENLPSLAERHGVGLDELQLEPVLVATFFPDLTEELVTSVGAEPTVLADRRTPAGRVFKAEGFNIATMFMGASAAVMLAEQWFASGVETLLVVGAAGSLQPRLPIGSIALPTEAVREEGTSHHYMPSDRPAVAGAGSMDALRAACVARDVEAVEGLHWTTDAPYREHVEKVHAFQDAGVLAVDMEVSALYIAAEHHGVDCAAVLAISDTLYEEAGWDAGFNGADYLGARTLAGEVALDAARSLVASRL